MWMEISQANRNQSTPPFAHSDTVSIRERFSQRTLRITYPSSGNNSLNERCEKIPCNRKNGNRDILAIQIKFRRPFSYGGYGASFSRGFKLVSFLCFQV